jgi:hypothetical protein
VINCPTFQTFYETAEYVNSALSSDDTLNISSNGLASFIHDSYETGAIASVTYLDPGYIFTEAYL